MRLRENRSSGCGAAIDAISSGTKPIMYQTPGPTLHLLHQFPSIFIKVSMAAVPLQLRAPKSAFRVCGDSAKGITFLHPGYPDGNNTLLILPRFDAGGVHYETARTACALLANNRWDGYFALTRGGDSVVDTLDGGIDGILMDQIYYFCLPSNITSAASTTERATEPYPVVPSFDNYRFPHGNLPSSWVAAKIEPAPSELVGERDRTCRITNWSAPLETSHIIPVAQESWWRSNQMALRYTRRPTASAQTHCPENVFRLRRDLHTLWDQHRICLVPKLGRWVVHVLDNPLTSELADTFHNLELQPLLGISRECLFARFALAIISDKAVLAKLSQVPLNLIIKGDDEQPRPTMLPFKEYTRRFAPPTRSRSRSDSPQKRQRSTEDSLEWADEPTSPASPGEAYLAWEQAQWGGKACDDNGGLESVDDDSVELDEDAGLGDEDEFHGRPRKRAKVKCPGV